MHWSDCPRPGWEDALGARCLFKTTGRRSIKAVGFLRCSAINQAEMASQHFFGKSNVTRDSVRRRHAALQGGAAQDALSWTVLDMVPEKYGLQIKRIVETGAGARNAVASIQDLATTSLRAAQHLSENYWNAGSDAARYRPRERMVLGRLVGRWGLALPAVLIHSQNRQQAFLPCQLHPVDGTPLHNLRAEHASIDRRFDFACNSADTLLQAFLKQVGIRTLWVSRFQFEVSLEPPRLSGNQHRVPS